MRRIIFVNRFYWPDETATAQLLADLAEALAARGRAVTVIASRPDRSVATGEERRGVRIERVGMRRGRGPGLWGKAVDSLAFYFAALVRLLRLAQKGDIVISLTDPPMIGVGAALVAGLRGARCVHWIQDIYPEVAVAVTGRRAFLFFRPWRNVAWQRAAACVTLGRDMAAVVAGAGVAPSRIQVIANWAPADLAPPPPEAIAARRAAWGLAGRFVALYSGNFGRVHDLAPLLDVAAALQGDSRILFLLVGDGAQRAGLEETVRRRRLGNVRFLPAQPRAQLAVSLAAGDVHLVALRAGCERLVFPSKLYGAAAVGRPVILLGPRDCEAARLVVERGFGCAFTAAETGAFAQTLGRLSETPSECATLGAAAARFAAAGGLAAAVEVWTRLLDSV